MVDNLIEIEAAVQILNKGEAKDENENPIDQNYKKLNTDITVLDKGTVVVFYQQTVKNGIFRQKAHIFFVFRKRRIQNDRKICQKHPRKDPRRL